MLKNNFQVPLVKMCLVAKRWTAHTIHGHSSIDMVIQNMHTYKLYMLPLSMVYRKHRKNTYLLLPSCPACWSLV